MFFIVRICVVVFVYVVFVFCSVKSNHYPLFFSFLFMCCVNRVPGDPLVLFAMPLLRFGLAGEVLRDELYCQMIKQIYTSHLPAKAQPPK